MSAEEIRGFGMRYAAAWSSQNPESLAAFYTVDGFLKVNDGEPAIGREAIANKARAFMTAFPDMVVALEDISLDGNQAVFRWHWTGTNDGPGGTGNFVDLYGFEAWTIGPDGLIEQSLGHYDAAEYERQVNAGPEDADDRQES